MLDVELLFSDDVISVGYDCNDDVLLGLEDGINADVLFMVEDNSLLFFLQEVHRSIVRHSTKQIMRLIFIFIGLLIGF